LLKSGTIGTVGDSPCETRQDIEVRNELQSSPNFLSQSDPIFATPFGSIALTVLPQPLISI
jgi:hypothetical protein